tara:strand:- start:1152 stop:2333 length:1182 start_codon:yes stop_codon:yes gene_type:complete
MKNKINIHPLILEIEKEIIDNRRYFHKHPELSFKEYNTSKIIVEKLEEMKIPYKNNIAKTGITATIEGREKGKTIALRADMDALPIQETSDVPYKSINDGIMHACGHDGHIAMLLGAAKAINQLKDNLKGNVKLIFQPAEEGHAGAKHMINEGVLDDVDEIYGIHLWNYQNVGEIGVKDGPIMAAADIFEIDIIGKGGHGATPHGTVDAIVVASHIINSMQTIVSRNTNPLESTVVTIGMINGGYNFNIIADKVTLKGTARSYTEENRSLIKNRMTEIIYGAEKMFGAKINLKYKDGYPPTINNIDCTRNVISAADKVISKKNHAPYLSMGGEDFSYYLEKIPGCFFFVGSRPLDVKPLSIPHHCSHFDIDEKSLLIGASTFVKIIEDILINC